MSTSPFFSAANRVDSSGITRSTIRFTLGVLRQYCSNASRTSSTAGVNETNLYGPAPIGAFLNPSSPTFSMRAFGTIPARAGRAPVERQKVWPWLFELEADMAGIGSLDRGDPILHQIARRAA